jgi:hypothetical protein
MRIKTDGSLFTSAVSGQISISTDAYKFSFLPRTITDWNSLHPEAYQTTTSESFKEIIQRLQT